MVRLAEELVKQADKVAQASCLRRQAGSLPYVKNSCSHLNQSLMELGALVCTPRNPQCLICPVKKLCVAFKENRTEELPNLGKREGARVGESIRACVAGHRFEKDGVVVRPTISIGVSAFPEDGAAADVLLRKADEALYRAKKTGRDRVNT